MATSAKSASTQPTPPTAPSDAAPDAAAAPKIDSPAADPPAPGSPAPDSPAAGSPAGDSPEAAPEKPRRGRPKGSTARTTRTIELILTVSGTVDGDWQAELKQGSTWISRGLPVTAAAVSRAARELHAELAEPIDTAIGAAREQRAAKVAELEAELERARKALAEIDG